MTTEKKLILLCKEQFFVLSKKQCLNLELLLNNTPNSNAWSQLGDILYAWSGTNYQNLCCKNNIMITDEQFLWIKQNINKDHTT